MSTKEEGTDGKPMASGTTLGIPGRNASGRPILGEIEELGDLIYKTGTKDQVDMYIRTTEKLAHYVGVKFGRDMRVLVANQEKKKFTKPERPRGADGKLLEDVFSRDDYKMNMDIYIKETKVYADQQSKVYSMIWGQCSMAVRNQLKNDQDFVALEEKDDVIGLLESASPFY